MEIVDSLEDYTTGVYDMFAHETNLDMNSRLIGFGLKNIDKENMGAVHADNNAFSLNEN